MKRRDQSEKNKSNRRVVLLVALPFILAVMTWKVREELRPIQVKIGSQSTKSRVLFERMSDEAHRHPYTGKISVEWSRAWPKASGLEMSSSEGLVLDRSQHSLFYSTDQYGWFYSHVENSGLDVLAKAQLQNNPITLPASVHAQLRARGWTLTEHYLP